MKLPRVTSGFSRTTQPLRHYDRLEEPKNEKELIPCLLK
jgi:hypothetical protein